MLSVVCFQHRLYKSQCSCLYKWQGCRLIYWSETLVSLQVGMSSISAGSWWFLNLCVDLREWIPKHVRWVFILCSQLTSHSFQMSHLTQSQVARIHFATGCGRECPGLQSSWISRLLFRACRQSTSSWEFFGQGGLLPWCIVSELCEFVRIPEYWTEAIPEIIQIYH